MFKFVQKGNFEKTEKYLKKLATADLFDGVERLANAGLEALRNATPVDTGKTAESWSYKIIKEKGSYRIAYANSNVHDGVNIAILLQYDHGTGTGGFVEGINYINPALRPVFEDMIKNVWKEASKP